MAPIALVTWDGGGNVVVTVAIAVELRARGHAVTVVGPRSLQSAVEPLELCFAELGIMPPDDPEQRLSYLLDVAQGTDTMLDELGRLTASADALVIDCNLSWALQSRGARRTGRPRAHRSRDIPAGVTGGSGHCQHATGRARGAAAGSGSGRMGPGRGRWRPQTGSVAIQPACGRPRVLISYSTESLQNSPQRVQTALDALAGLPLDVLASTSGAFAAGRLRVPANATVLDYLPHDSVMANVDLMVCHGGHGTTMAALSCGVPLVCVPGLGRDQAPIAARVSELGLGIALDGDVTTGTIRDAVMDILADHHFRSRAQEFAHRSGQPDGARQAAIELLAMLDEAI